MSQIQAEFEQTNSNSSTDDLLDEVGNTNIELMVGEEDRADDQDDAIECTAAKDANHDIQQLYEKLSLRQLKLIHHISRVNHLVLADILIDQ